MGLLTPSLLLLGLAAAVPIVLHLFQRHQGPRIIFPALRYLRRAEKESARQIKLRQLLLMLLRIAAIVLVAVAAARPFARRGGAGHEPTAVAIVLDNSMSTGVVVRERRVLDELKALALTTLEQAGPDDRFWLLRAGAPWEPAMAGDAAETAARVRETEPTAAAADVAGALAHARALLAAGADGRATEIQLLSDLQAQNFASVAESDENGPPVVVWVPDSEPPPNVAVSSVEVGAGIPPTAGQRSTVAAAVDGASDSDSVRMRLSIEGRVVAASVAPVEAVAVMPLSARPAGLYAGWVETDADALRADDRRFFTLQVLPPPAVAVSDSVPFVEDALAVMATAGRIRPAPLEAADVAILDAAARLDAVPAERTAIILPPESPLELPAVNRRLGEAGIPWRYEPQRAGGESRFDSEGLSDDLSRTFERVRLTQVYPLRRQGASAGDTVLLRLREGLDWAVRGERARGGRYILLASPLSSAATTLPTSAAMVPLLDRLVTAWAAATPSSVAVEAGRKVSLPPGANAVALPDGRVEPATGDYTVGSQSGVHRVLAGDRTLALLAVNPPRIESDLRRLDSGRLDHVVPGSIEAADSPGEWADDIFRNRLGSELWRAVVLASLLVLAIEAAVAASGRARRGRTREDVTASRAPAAQHGAPLAGVGSTEPS